MNYFKICSLNINGYQGKLQHLTDRIEKIKPEIICLQETHANTIEKIEELEKNFPFFDIICPMTIDSTKGVCIMIKKQSFIEKFEIKKLINNRAIQILLKGKNDIEIELLNIYSPNTISEQKDFVEEVCEISWSTANRIILGDFNFSLEGNNNYSNKKKREIWNKFFELSETSEISNIDYQATWISGNNQSRIDRIYASDNLKKKNFSYANENKNFIFSDHNFVIGRLCFEFRAKKSEGKKIWKLNDSVFNDDNFINLEHKLKKILYSIKIFENDSATIYEQFMKSVREMLIKECRLMFRIKNKEKQILINKSSENLTNEEEKRIKNALEKIYKSEIKGIQIRAREDRKLFIYQPKQALIIKEKINHKNNYINKFRDVEGNILTENDEIRCSLFDSYNNLMGVKRGNESLLNQYRFRKKTLLKDGMRAQLEKPFEIQEIQEVIDNMTTSAPGPNGITLIFFKKFFHIFSDIFVDMLNKNINTERLPSQMKESLIKFIPKNNDEIKSMKTLRPISLTNIDYRIMAKATYNRLSKVLGEIIGNWQKCSIPGRKIDSIIIQIRDLIDHANINNKSLFITAIDQWKAFDSISHEYVLKTVEHSNLGKRLFTLIKSIYDNPIAKIYVNNNETEKIIIKSGIKQGCPLSMALYVLAIEEVLVNINLDKNINGYKYRVLSEINAKAKAYADDVTAITSDEKSIVRAFEIMSEWGEISGAVVNKDKTQIIQINGNISGELKKYVVEQTKILGIIFNHKGINNEMIENCIEIIKKKCDWWNKFRLNMLERIVIFKCLIFSKILYVSNFVEIKKSTIDFLEKLSLEFVWNKKRQRIKKGQLYQKVKYGGLNMLSVRDKIESQQARNFAKAINNFEQEEMQFIAFWFKMQPELRNKINNFNIFCGGLEKERPDIYGAQFKSFKKFKSIIKSQEQVNSNLNVEVLNMNSKFIYQEFVNNYKPEINIESKIFLDAYKIQDSRYKVLNYKIIMNALPLNPVIGKNDGLCSLCHNHRETTKHLFCECEVALDIWDNTDSRLVRMRIDERFEEIVYHKNLSREQISRYSVVKHSIWIKRCDRAFKYDVF